MIDWWGLVHNSLWVLGLALALAALSIASYRSRAEGAHLRQELSEPRFQLPFNVGMSLFCLGLLFSGRHWWEKTLWGLLAVLFAVQAIWLWRSRPRPVLPPESQEIAVPLGPEKRRQTNWLAWGLVLAGLLILLGWLLVTGFQLLGHARSLQSHLQQLERLAQGDAGGLGAAELQNAGQHLLGMRRELEAIQSQVGPLLPAARLLSWLPKYGGDLAAAADLLDLAVAVSAAGDRTFQALAPVLDLLDGSQDGAGDGSSIGERLLPVLIAAQPELHIARQELGVAQQAQANIDAQDLSPRVAGLLDRLDRYLPWFEIALDGALLAPDLLGADGPRNYLILAQNNYELRPTGGFVTGVGEVRVENGWLASMEFGDTSYVDDFKVPQLVAPLDFQRTLFGQLLLFRDANWDADYPTSARRALEIYANNQGFVADGVVALDLVALQSLVAAIGPLQVEDVAEPVTGKNVLRLIEEAWGEDMALEGRERSQWEIHRKDVMGQIARAAMDKLMSGQDVQPVALARALKQALEEKHILIYLDDPQAAQLLRRQNWDGALAAPAVPSDALLVADANVGFNKMDANLARSIHYRVDLGAEGGPQARLTLTYRNLSTRAIEECVQGWQPSETYRDLMERCYWNYVRVYVPAGSQLLAGPHPQLPAGSLAAQRGEPPVNRPISPTLTFDGWQAWTAFFDLAPDSELTLTYDYLLPGRVWDEQADGLVYYRLRIQKQPGTEATPLQVEIILPPGAELVEAVPADLPQASIDLRTDREFLIVFRKGEP